MKQKMQWGKWCFLAAILLLSLGCESLKGRFFLVCIRRFVLVDLVDTQRSEAWLT